MWIQSLYSSYVSISSSHAMNPQFVQFVRSYKPTLSWGEKVRLCEMGSEYRYVVKICFQKIFALLKLLVGVIPTITTIIMTAAGKGVRKRGIPGIRITNRFPTEQPLPYFRTSLVLSVNLTVYISYIYIYKLYIYIYISSIYIYMLYICFIYALHMLYIYIYAIYIYVYFYIYIYIYTYAIFIHIYAIYVCYIYAIWL